MTTKKVIMFILTVLVAVSLIGYYYNDAYSATSTTATATKTISQSSNVVYTTHSQSIYNILKKMGFNVKLITNTKPSTPAPAPTPKPTPAPAPTPAPTPTQGLTADEQTMLNLVNKERVANGLKPLTIDMRVLKTARLKSADIVKLGYFNHQSPTYGSPFDMMKKYGINYSYAGENLAGAPDVNSAHVNLMNSPGHRENILRPEFTKVGIGVVEGSKYGKIFTQQFIRE